MNEGASGQARQFRQGRLHHMAQQRQLAQRHHAMVVARGLYLLRYVSAPARRGWPTIAVNQHPVNHDITLIAPPGGSDTHLNRPGDCMVLRADAPGSLTLVAEADSADTAIDAEIRLERIVAADEQQPPARKAPAKARRVQPEPDSISILAHVARRGDVIVQPGEWICGPDLPLPIEGLEIRWPDCPDGVELTYSAVSGRGAKRRPVVAGAFAGSRGRAAALTGLTLSLSGTAARDYELAGEALFLGAAINAQRGRELSFIGPSGGEPLVGLRLEIVRATDKPASRALPATPAVKRPTGKVRVYRSGAGLPAAPMQIEPKVVASNRGF
jgi:hypothetical protein